MAEAKRHIRAYLRHGVLEPDLLDGALEAVVRSWQSRAQGGAASKRKGKMGEREACSELGELFPDLRRGWQSRAGTDEPDVTGGPWWVEVKRLRRIAAVRHLEQAERDTDGRPAVVVMREDRGQWVAMMRLSTLKQLLDAKREKPNPRDRTGQSIAGSPSV